jgi:tRNA-specific 2-thiouridylase
VTDRVLVAMSGGVDSSVAAATLVEQGYQVTGVTMLLQPGKNAPAEHAASVAAILGIPHTSLDLIQPFAEKVISPFFKTYLAGLTPNPCITCNQFIKFGTLMDYAAARGFDYLATGHYARISVESGAYRLMRGTDRSKDQSYFLYTLDQSRLSRILFPLGSLDKKTVKANAASMGIASAVQPDESQDACFIPRGGRVALLADLRSPVSGDIVDASGKVLGRHKGVAGYTVGQRRGLCIPSAEPLYVTAIDAAASKLVVGPRSCLYRSSMTAAGALWVSGSVPKGFEGVTARIRYKSSEFAVRVIILHNKLQLGFDQPQPGVTPGQSVVLYRDDEVLGGAIID